MVHRRMVSLSNHKPLIAPQNSYCYSSSRFAVFTLKSQNFAFKFVTWSQRFNATDMSTIYPYATITQEVSASHQHRARGNEPRPRARRKYFGNRKAFRSSAKHNVSRSEPQ